MISIFNVILNYYPLSTLFRTHSLVHAPHLNQLDKFKNHHQM
jgi:hypothetical protein